MAQTKIESLKWEHMNASQKASFTGKLIIFLISFGFAFPTLLSD